ncbi:hypothetical protein F4212_04465 [Candidatus Poribacteria bacterium]|nr:hypothetical protein [Candidatus Poribacteria bacterium]
MQLDHESPNGDSSNFNLVIAILFISIKRVAMYIRYDLSESVIAACITRLTAECFVSIRSSHATSKSLSDQVSLNTAPAAYEPMGAA